MKKKIALICFLFFSAVILLSSCKSTEKCAAYGEANRYRVESR